MKSNETKVNSQGTKNNVFTPLGDAKMPSLERVFNKESEKYEIVVKSEIDIQEELQRSSNSYDLAMLKAKYKLTGELPPDTGGYGDVDQDLTMFPDNIHELYKVRNKLQTYFEGLDPKLQATYGSFENYVTSIYSGQIPQATKDYYAALATEKELEALKQAKENANE